MNYKEMKEYYKGQFHEGERGSSFKEFLKKMLNKGNIKQKYIKTLLSDKHIKKYSKAFTSPTYDEQNNYENYEQLGDLSINKFIVWYIYKRFPQLNCPLGVKVAARLRINYGATKSLFGIGEKLGFWDYISSSLEYRKTKKKALIEDTVEAFIGCT